MSICRKEPGARKSRDREIKGFEFAAVDHIHGRSYTEYNVSKDWKTETALRA